MNIFSGLFKKKSAVEILDPIFGNLSYEDGVWISIPKPVAEVVMIVVEAPESGPTELQKGLFQRIHSNLPELEQRAREFLRPHVDTSIDVSNLSIYSVEIAGEIDTSKDKFVLELSDENAVIIHRVCFSGVDPITYESDD